MIFVNMYRYKCIYDYSVLWRRWYVYFRIIVLKMNNFYIFLIVLKICLSFFEVFLLSFVFLNKLKIVLDIFRFWVFEEDLE